jgi:hypothetical protein
MRIEIKLFRHPGAGIIDEKPGTIGSWERLNIIGKKAQGAKTVSRG